MTRVYGPAALLGFILTIFAANYSIAHIGWCSSTGPCTVPVAPPIPGLWESVWAPSGVLWIGLAFVLRDLVHETYGPRGALLAILAGALLSWYVAPAFALASGVAFLLSELADLFVYAPLRERHLVAAATASNTVGALVDSALFLWLAFGSLAFIEGQIIGKILMSAIGVTVIWWLRWHARHSVST